MYSEMYIHHTLTKSQGLSQDSSLHPRTFRTIHLSNYSIVNKTCVRSFVRAFVCLLALRSRSRPTTKVMPGLSVILTLINTLSESGSGRGSSGRGRMSIPKYLLTGLFNATNKKSFEVDG